MRLLLFVLLFAYVCMTEASRTKQNKNILPGGGKIWALLAATSKGWENYRHQADVCHAYQVLRRNGIPDENIIVMMADDIAYNPRNPTPGVIINQLEGPNVYVNVPKDYTGKDVNRSNFLNALKGNRTGVNGTSGGRVIESGPNDHIFVFVVDHGGPGFLPFPDGLLMADQLMTVLEEMSNNSRFAKMVMFVDTCQTGSLFDNILDETLNIFVLAASGPFESSWGCCNDTARGVQMGDLFSVTWLAVAEHENLLALELHSFYSEIRSAIKVSSNVLEYGNLDIGSSKVSEFLGFSPARGHRMRGRSSVDLQDIADTRNISLVILEKQIENVKDPSELKERKMKLNALLKKRRIVDQVFQKIMQEIHVTADELKRINLKRFRLHKNDFPCYNNLLDTFEHKCFNLYENTYASRHLHKFINICVLGGSAVREALDGIKSVCPGEPSFPNLHAV